MIPVLGSMNVKLSKGIYCLKGTNNQVVRDTNKMFPRWNGLEFVNLE